MNLRKLFFGKKEDGFEENKTQHEVLKENMANENATIINFPNSKKEEVEVEQKDLPSEIKSRGFKYQGLIEENTELDIFFNKKFYYSKGFYSGINQRSKEALETGLNEITQTFINVLDKVIQQKERFLDQAAIADIDSKEVSKSISSKLNLTCDNVKKEIEVLQAQKKQAQLNEGWIKEAINRFKKGFIEGHQLFIDNHFLGFSSKGVENE